jgi:hypothetical protein
MNRAASVRIVKGLAGFLVGVYPDRARTSADEGQCRIELVFDV